MWHFLCSRYKPLQKKKLAVQYVIQSGSRGILSRIYIITHESYYEDSN
jgi:hypothetical protein